MKLETTFRFPKSTILLLFLFIFSIQSYASNNCGEINGFEFSNGSESMAIENGGVYNITDIPSNAFINLLVDGYSQSVRYAVRNDNTNEYDYITENVEPYTYPAGNRAWNLGTGTFTIRADLHRYNNGYGQRCDREMITFTVTETCNAFSGTATATMPNVSLVDGMATISATPNGDAVIPDGFTLGFVLTLGDELVIVDGDDISSFPVTEPGNYTIHPFVYNPNTLDVGIVEFGVTTGVDVLGLISQGGGNICASLDVTGAPVTVESCEADARTLMANMDTACLVDGMATISATSNNDAVIPDDYSSIYVLTQGEGLVIVNAGAEPSFEITEGGNYTIHTLVYNPDTLDLGILEFGVTTGFDVFRLIIPGGGTICAALDVAGAPVSVENPMAGTLTADMDMATLVDGATTISATPNGDINIPDGYSSIYVLTQGDDLVIVNAGAEPNFEVTEAGNYTIHTLVYNPNTLDLGIVELGVTTGVDVLGLISQGGGDICASLDVAGAPVTVMEESCTAEAGTMYSSSPITCLMSGMASIEAMQNRPAETPDGYEQLFVLTEAFSLTILNVSVTPNFDVTDRGFYRIHSLVYNPETLDLSIVVPGETTGFDVVNLINNNDICASLDVHGAVNLVLGYNWFCSFFNNYYHKDAGLQSADVTNYIKDYSSYKTFEDDFIANNAEISLYPNPVKSTLNVSIQTFDDEVMTYKMRDMSGRQVATGLNNSLNNGSGQIDATNLANGMYIISFESDYRTIIKKIMVNK
ncbi:T9SS type A sorting domain-containing protein [Bizionia sp.]|uniref:T9SS type A sorting domain-containing protein n=1 Tax=Bizionia sp. TaxID=1954480 RepID=UPI003A947404